MSSEESPLIITDPNPIATDMVRLDGLLQQAVAPHLKTPDAKDLRILNLACGRCDEAETLVRFAQSKTKGDVRLTGADIRIREIRQARELHSHLPAEFLIEDATRSCGSASSKKASQRSMKTAFS